MATQESYLIVSYRGEKSEIDIQINAEPVKFDHLFKLVFAISNNQDIILKYHHRQKNEYLRILTDFNVKQMFRYFKGMLEESSTFECIVHCENNGHYSFITSELENKYGPLECKYPSSNTGRWIFTLQNDPSRAIKVYTNDDSTFNDTDLYRELNNTLIFSHENIIKIDHYFPLTRKISGDREQVYVCYGMDFYKEGSLQSLIDRKEKIDEETTLDIFLQIAKAMECMQNKKIIHRDLTPSNILVSLKRLIDNKAFYSIKVSDFEFATFINSSSIKSIKGASKYAPEVALKGYSYESDIYSLGLLIYMLRTFKSEYKEVELEKLSFSNDLTNLIRQMMDSNPLSRPKIHQVINTINNCIRTRQQYPTLLIAIDFGTARSGYGVCYDSSGEFKEEYVKSHMRINEHWDGKSSTEYKNLTEILYENETPIAWGFEARKKYPILCELNPSKQYYLIDNIKMSIMKVSENDIGEIESIDLRQFDSPNINNNSIREKVFTFEKEVEKLRESPTKKNVSKNVVKKVTNLFRKKETSENSPNTPTTPTAEITQTTPIKENGKIYLVCRKKKFLLLKVIGDYLRLMYQYIIKNLEEDSIPYTPGTSVISLSIPAIWNDKMKNLMREAAKLAGIVNDQYSNLKFVYEPEVAGIACMKLTNLELKDGQIYIVVDVGGGTIDITAYRVSGGSLSQIYKANGGPSGGKYVDKAFLNYILQKCKNAQYTSRQRLFEVLENNEGYPEFMENWEEAKCNMEENPDKLIIYVPMSICEFFKETSQSSIDSIFDLKTGRIKLDKKDIQAIFKDTINTAMDHIEKAYSSDELKSENVDYLFFVGGFSGCSMLKREIIGRFQKRSKIVHPRSEYRSCIIKGAIISLSQSKNPIVKKRILTHTYGVGVQRNFSEDDDPTKQVGDLCEDVFEIFVRSGDSVDLLDTIKKTFKVNANSLNLDVAFYSTTSKNPRYITDQGVNKIALLHIMLPVGTLQQEATVEMEFGGTEIKSRVIVGTRSSDWVLLDVNAVVKNDHVYLDEPYIYDICFVMDATSSMALYIDATKSYILDLVKSVFEKVQNTKYFKIRISYITYRDFFDAEPLTVLDFVELSSNSSIEVEIKYLEDNIGRTEADGGDDTAEDMMLGLYAALKLNWKGDKKLIILIADDPCHGLKYNGLTKHQDCHNDCYLHYPQREPEKIFERIIREGIELSVVNVNNTRMETMLNFFSQLYNSESRVMDIIDMNESGERERILKIFNQNLTKSVISKLIVIEEEDILFTKRTKNSTSSSSSGDESFETVS